MIPYSHIGSGKGSLNGPVPRKPQLYDVIFKAEKSAPLCQCFCLSLISNKFIKPTVVVLLLLCCPTTISRLIVTIIVYAVNAVLWSWSMPHIGKKVFKLMPAFADRNTATAVMFVGRRFFIATSLYHSVPNPVNRSAIFFMCRKIILRKLSAIVIIKASARYSMPCFKRIALYNFSHSAVALTEEICATIFSLRGDKSQYYKPAKSLSSKINALLVVLDKAHWLPFNITKTLSRCLGNWRRITATAFAQFNRTIFHGAPSSVYPKARICTLGRYGHHQFAGSICGCT